MSEKIPAFENPEKKMTKEERAQLAKELTQKNEGFAFSGIEEAAYKSLKEADEEYPGFTTPIDELIEKMKSAGMKVSLGDDPESGNAWILPLDSEDVGMDSILPRHLKMSDDMDPELKKLVQAFRDLAASKK